jgi:prevent-host-death family protein
MDVTATEAKNRLGQMLEACQREPVVIEKSGRRHSVLLSAAGAATPMDERPPRTADEFYARYKDWVDEQNRQVEKYGIWNQEFRTW